MTDTLTIRLGEKLASALKNESQQTGLTKGEIARQALEARFQRDSQLTVMKRYFGVMNGARDLSTNKSYRRQWNKKRA